MVEVKDKAEIVDRNPKDDVGRYVAEFTDGIKSYMLETYATELDGHFLLYVDALFSTNSTEVFGVVDLDKPHEADKRLYNRARSFVKDCDIDDKTRHAQNSELEVTAAS